MNVKKKIKKRSGGGSGSPMVYSMDSNAYQKAIRDSGMVFVPEVHYPALGLALTQHLCRAGGINGADDFEERLSKQFPDSMMWPQFLSFLGMFRFSSPPTRVMDAFLGILTTLLLVWRSLGGVEFAWRLWCGLFEDIIGDADVQWAKGEPVASLVVREGDHYGWDSHFPHYHLLTWRTLENSVDRGKAERTLVYAASTPQGHHFRAVADGLLRLVYDQGDQYVAGATGDQVTGSLLEHVARNNPHLLQPAAQDNVQQAYTASIFGDQSVIAPTSASAWATRMRELTRAETGRAPAWPIEGGTVRDLSRLLDVHRFGAVRKLKTGGKSAPHQGLDIPVARGTGAKALYSGSVVELRDDYQESDAKSKTDGWAKGNYVVIETPTGVDGATMRHGYYHLDSVAKGLKVGSSVSQAQEIGAVGSTGNSTGPHLHLETRWLETGGHSASGEPMMSRAIDPERVIEEGLITAARQAGLGLGDVDEARPVLAPVLWTLGAVASPGHMMPDNVASLPLGNALLDMGRRATNTMLNAMESGPGRAALQAAWLGVGVPPSAVDSMIAALRAGYETSVSSGADPGAVIKASLAALTPAASAAAADPRVQQIAQQQLQAAAAGGMASLGALLGSSVLPSAPGGGGDIDELSALAGLDTLMSQDDDEDI